MKRSLEQLAEIAQKAVRIGNELVKATRPQSVTEKTDRDTYTDVDIRIEREVRAYLAEATPDIGFVGEEEGFSVRPTLGDDLLWTFDPIDGTANFVHNIPLCAVQLSLIHQNKATVAAISLPYFDMHYMAIEHKGAYRNGSRIKVSEVENVSKAIVSIGDYATGNGASEKNKQRVALTAALAQKVERIRMFGSAAHDFVWTAEGRVDATIILSNDPIDVAAGVLLAQEAGATITDLAGQQYSTTSTESICATPKIAADLLRIAQNATAEHRKSTN